jgi:hypothetical protein
MIFLYQARIKTEGFGFESEVSGFVETLTNKFTAEDLERAIDRSIRIRASSVGSYVVLKVEPVYDTSN